MLFVVLFIVWLVKNDLCVVEVMKGVYIGSVGVVKNVEALREFGVTYVLIVCGGMLCEGFYFDDFEYVMCVVDDKFDVVIDEYFD